MYNKEILLTLILLLASTGHAETMRCGTQVISEGLSALEVLDKCGEPDYKTTRYEEVIKKNPDKSEHKQTIVIEEWSYKGHAGQLRHFLTFANGRLRAITWGERE